MPIGRSGPHGATGVGFLAQQPQFGVYSIDQIHILRPIWKSLPDQPYPPNAFQSWTASYVLSLIGQDRLPIGEQVTDLAPSQRPLDRIWPSWTASYNLNLRGKDQLPVGDQFTELPPRPASRLTDYTWIVAGNNFPPLPPPPPSNVIFRPYWKGLPDQPPTPLLQQSVFQAYPTLYTVVAALPVPLAKQITDTPAQPSRLDQTWTWQYNKNLIGQDQLPVGEQVYLLVPSQVVPDQIQLRSWQWSFNLNLIGRDRLPIGEQVTDLAPSQRTPEQIQLHSWLWSYNLNLRGKDQVPVGEQISELAPSQKPAEQPQLRVWTWSYNLSLIAQDRLPVGEQIWERPTLPVAPALTWTHTPAYEEIANPILQTECRRGSTRSTSRWLLRRQSKLRRCSSRLAICRRAASSRIGAGPGNGNTTKILSRRMRCRSGNPIGRTQSRRRQSRIGSSKPTWRC
jgi:hypothetical protein